MREKALTCTHMLTQNTNKCCPMAISSLSAALPKSWFDQFQLTDWSPSSVKTHSLCLTPYNTFIFYNKNYSFWLRLSPQNLDSYIWANSLCWIRAAAWGKLRPKKKQKKPFRAGWVKEGWQRMGRWSSLPWVSFEVRLVLPDTVPSGWMSPTQLISPLERTEKRVSRINGIYEEKCCK